MAALPELFWSICDGTQWKVLFAWFTVAEVHRCRQPWRSCSCGFYYRDITASVTATVGGNAGYDRFNYVNFVIKYELSRWAFQFQMCINNDQLLIPDKVWPLNRPTSFIGVTWKHEKSLSYSLPLNDINVLACNSHKEIGSWKFLTIKCWNFENTFSSKQFKCLSRWLEVYT